MNTGRNTEPPMIYLDNAATTWPKPSCVTEAVCDAIVRCGGNPGRGGHRLALAAGELLYEARDAVAAFFGCDDPFRVSFTQNITMAVNLVLRGYLKAGDHVLISPMEHNAVMRPLSALGVRWDVIPHTDDGKIEPDRIAGLVRPETKLIILCHESNVNGVVQPLREAAKAAHEKGILLLADCAQSAGTLPLDIEADQIDFLCFTGHKGLLGPTGTGGVIFGSRVDIDCIDPLVRGGTGSLSESITQPEFLPDRFESGTQNVCGFAGLNAGIRWITEQGRETLFAKEQALIRKLENGLSGVRGLRVYSGEGTVLSVTIDGADNGVAAAQLEERYGIMTRIGLHCAPMAHRTLGTFPDGTIRFAVSPFTSEAEIGLCIDGCAELAEDAWKKN